MAAVPLPPAEEVITMTRARFREILAWSRDYTLMRAAILAYDHRDRCTISHECAEMIGDDIRRFMEKLRGER